MAQRPPQFTLNASHPLAQGLVFAGLGQLPGSTRYADSSVFGNHGTLTNMDPATDWVWIPELNRIATDYDGANDVTQSASSAINGLTQATFSFWVRQSSSGGSAYGAWMCALAAYNNSSGFFIGRNEFDGAQYWIGSNSAYTTGEPENQWRHIAVRYRANDIRQLWTNGQLKVDSSPVNVTFGNLRHELGNNTTTAIAARCTIADCFIHNRVLSDQEIKQLADPSNVMLSGLIQAPRRRLWPVKNAGAAPAGRRYSLLTSAIIRSAR